MTQRILIDPVSRIEGHAKISIYLDDDGQVEDARFHVTEFRGFERFCVGRPLWEMAGITARVCGICPVSHLIASAKAGDKILAVQVPPGGEKLRRLMNLSQIIQSHALSFFHLSAPDLLFGMESDPTKRNVFGLIAAEPELARGGIRLRQFGQEIIAALGGQKIHPAWSVPGGVRAPLLDEDRAKIRAWLPEVAKTIASALERFKGLLDDFEEEVSMFGNFPTLHFGLVTKEGNWEHYDGHLRFVDGNGNIIADKLDPSDYQEYIGEAVQPSSFLKSPYYRPIGYPDGVYRVGPLARLNVCERMGTPLADRELMEYRQRGGRTVNASFFYHYARLIEIQAAIETIDQTLDDPDMRNDHLLRATAGVNALQGVGVGEAPRGTLFHHYQVDKDGLIEKVNLVIATGQNNLAMNRSVAQIAKHYIRGRDIPEGTLNRLEAGIRAFDPCLSCSTHAVGMMPLHLEVVGSNGVVVNEVWRD
jgi:NAD-reducing hydrogenase large subunit